MNCRLILLLIVTWPVLSFAHIDLVKAIPDKNEILLKPVDTVRLKFSGKVEIKFSKIEVYDSSSKQRVDSEKNDFDSKENTLFTSLKGPLKVGKYHVKWKATSTDSHKANGEYDFTYAPKN